MLWFFLRFGGFDFRLICRLGFCFFNKASINEDTARLFVYFGELSWQELRKSWG